MPVQATKSIIIKADVSDVFDTWADFEQFPKFMPGFLSVTRTGPDTAHWVADGPLGVRLEWDARITRFEKDKRIAWNTTGGDVETTGQVTFNSLPPDETEVTVIWQYALPGAAPHQVKSFFSDLDTRLAEDLRSFKHYCENAARPAVSAV